jgi:hypothetical protein
MNPWSLAPPVLVAVGNGGNEEVSVVARRVGLKRREDACAVGVNNLEHEAQQALYVLYAAKSGHSRAGLRASPVAYR